MRFNAPHIIFRNGHPYFMLRVPTDLADKFNKRFIRKSLKTSVFRNLHIGCIQPCHSAGISTDLRPLEQQPIASDIP